MGTLVRPDLRARLKQALGLCLGDDRSNRRNLMDVRRVLDLWFAAIDRVRR
ncbi:MAG TPA: hypothetical protein VHL98_02560 [Microvirga sp.]|jgi:hypothetical protein|nr:hypothetical protein [Microvirga sp.]